MKRKTTKKTKTPKEPKINFDPRVLTEKDDQHRYADRFSDDKLATQWKGRYKD